MTLPLRVRIGSDHPTQRIDGLTFRAEAVGGIQSIGFRIAYPVDRVDLLPHYETVTIYNAHTGETVATGQLTDPGRSVSADGQRWAVSVFGPAEHVNDIELPLIYVDQSLSDGWRQINRNNRGAQWSQSTLPSNDGDNSPESIVLNMPEGSTLATGDSITVRNETLREAGQQLGRVSFSWDSGGPSDTDYRLRLWTSDNPSAVGDGSSSWSATLNPAGGSAALVVTTDFTNGRNVPDLIMDRQTGSGKPADDSKWFGVYNWVLRARLVDETGTAITAGASYANDYVLAHEVVKDLLGRCLPEFDGAGSYVDTSCTHQIDSLAYRDGATAGQVLEDLMTLEPTHRWWVTPAGQFRWEPWPTTPRYWATLDDGGEFPASGMELFNAVHVRWRDKRGRVRSTRRTAADAGVDDLYLGPAGKTRRKLLDLGDEVASSANATRRADQFLANHVAPANAGRLNVARPIWDSQLGRNVEPFEIQPGELVVVRGVESYPDALNASSSDGQTVFRIWGLDYNADGNTATLELDTLPRSTYGALVRLLKKRSRRR